MNFSLFKKELLLLIPLFFFKERDKSVSYFCPTLFFSNVSNLNDFCLDLCSFGFIFEGKY
ncbi:hypothetical protein CRM96_02925 [Enterococcus durans]|uniref:Uncharacterized protein n=1 Tax=Enterococcus durans TaxID=53345 RepID=A0AB36S5W7_9ENTE|nr:hypothetical protein CRM96_02925 [Enterococcus durans]RSL36119.1 hypothetical protein B7758_09250 [Enterococcus durans]RXE77069.1 hypothetical protein EIA52_10195 [Enterococcus durans]RYT09189.1 hypothetical protein EAI85_05735 [Enterococcus durans]